MTDIADSEQTNDNNQSVLQKNVQIKTDHDQRCQIEKKQILSHSPSKPSKIEVKNDISNVNIVDSELISKDSTKNNGNQKQFMLTKKRRSKRDSTLSVPALSKTQRQSITAALNRISQRKTSFSPRKAKSCNNSLHSTPSSQSGSLPSSVFGGTVINATNDDLSMSKSDFSKSSQVSEVSFADDKGASLQSVTVLNDWFHKEKSKKKPKLRKAKPRSHTTPGTTFSIKFDNPITLDTSTKSESGTTNKIVSVRQSLELSSTQTKHLRELEKQYNNKKDKNKPESTPNKATTEDKITKKDQSSCPCILL